MSKRRNRCLSGHSPLESPEKVRGMEEFNDNFIIELEDDELRQEEMEKKERDEEMEVGWRWSRGRRRGSCPSGF